MLLFVYWVQTTSMMPLCWLLSKHITVNRSVKKPLSLDRQVKGKIRETLGLMWEVVCTQLCSSLPGETDLHASSSESQADYRHLSLCLLSCTLVTCSVFFTFCISVRLNICVYCYFRLGMSPYKRGSIFCDKVCSLYIKPFL